ncbi:glutathione S-transferase family protein [Bradyrhizobium sp. 2TAF24]|uniref:glutathione S-transferase family protein n=1 Tax=Bradyrhizobium sp. 2TAF24 TaxID=3233011 RepID=UPI003F8ECA2A
MLTIHGVPLSVHTRKPIVTAILKKLDYTFEVVIPVIPDNPPANWNTLSPTGLIPVLQDGGYTLPDSTAICLYLEKKQPAPAILPDDAKHYGRVLWFDAYAGGTIYRHVVHPLFIQTIVRPNIRKESTDKALVDDVLNNVQPKILNYLESQISGKFLVGDTMTLADIAIVSNFIVYHYMGYRLDAAKYPKLIAYIKGIAATDAYGKALDDERPFVASMGLDRSFFG